MSKAIYSNMSKAHISYLWLPWIMTVLLEYINYQSISLYRPHFYFMPLTIAIIFMSMSVQVAEAFTVSLLHEVIK